MPENTIILDAGNLQEKALALRFDLPQLGEHVTGFAIRYDGQVHPYINQCAHLPVELDWNEGQFFTQDKVYLICATHGAQYEPDTGHCVFGPCKGGALKALPVTEEGQQVLVHLGELIKDTK